MSQVKLSVSLSPSEVETLDKYARAAGLKSRSAAIQQAIKLLGDPELEDAYAAAWQEWEDSGESEAWAGTVAGDTVFTRIRETPGTLTAKSSSPSSSSFSMLR